MAEMTPLTAAQAASFAPGDYTIDALDPRPFDPSAVLRTTKTASEGVGKIKNASSQMLAAAALLGFQSKELTIAAASFELIAGAMEAYSAYRMLREVLTVERIAEGIAALAKYQVAAPIVAAAAVGAALAFSEEINSAVRTVDIEGDYGTPAGVRELQSRVNAARWS
jgi:hypothetical protein